MIENKDFEVERYLSEVGSQIRSKKAKDFVLKELSNHIEEQAQAYLKEGEDHALAYQKAVREMGDPVDVGVSLDRIHRPHLEWKFLILIAVVSMFGLILSFAMQKSLNQSGISPLSAGCYLFLGIGMCFLMYRLDYSVIKGKSSRFAIGFLVVLAYIAIGGLGTSHNGIFYFRIFGLHSIMTVEVMMLYLPLFAGVLYDYRGQKKWTYCKLLFFFLAPVFLMRETMSSITLIFVMVLSEIILVVIALKKGWYSISWKWVLPTVCLFLAGSIFFCFHPDIVLGEGNYMWLKGFINGYEGDDYTYGVLSNKIRMDIEDSKWFGSVMSGSTGVPDKLYMQEYLLAGITAYLGKAAALSVILLLIGIAIYIFYISVRQKNQLGMIIGISCGMILLLKIVLHAGVVFGLLPFDSAMLPFLSFGGSNIVISYALAGLVLSIFRYKDILEPETANSPNSVND